MNFYRDQESGMRVFYGSSRHRPPGAHRSPQPTTARRRQPTTEEPRAIGTIVKATIINAIMDQHPAICRRLVQEAVVLGCERATDQARGIRR